MKKKIQLNKRIENYDFVGLQKKSCHFLGNSGKMGWKTFFFFLEKKNFPCAPVFVLCCNLNPLQTPTFGFKQFFSFASQGGGINGAPPPPGLIFVFLGEKGFPHLGRAGLEPRSP